MQTSGGLGLVFQYFFMVGSGIGAGLLLPFAAAMLIKSKLSEGLPWRRNSRSS